MPTEEDAESCKLDHEALLKKSLKTRTMKKSNLQKKIIERERAESALSKKEEQELGEVMDKVAEVAAHSSLATYNIQE